MDGQDSASGPADYTPAQAKAMKSGKKYRAQLIPEEKADMLLKRARSNPSNFPERVIEQDKKGDESVVQSEFRSYFFSLNDLFSFLLKRPVNGVIFLSFVPERVSQLLK